jgi:hypothetical protein
MSIGRLMASFLLLAPVVAVAQPAVTTIQDTIYKADGTLMNATAVITWNAFEAADQTEIGMQTISVPIVNGNIYVQLVANTTGTPSQPYNVTYSSDGMIQFGETWMVPPSTTPLRIRDVRTGTTVGGAGGGSLSGGGNVASGPITESGVTGLLTDLSSRPLKDSSYIPGRVAIVDSSGALGSVAGNFNDCVYVNGTSGPCFDPTQLSTYSDSETPAGVVDGNNASFVLIAKPSPTQSLILFRNGLAQKQGFDYALTSSGVQFLQGAAPQPGDTLIAWYRAASVAAGGGVAQGLAHAGNLQGGLALITLTPQVICSTAGAQTNGTALVSLGSCTIPANFLGAGDRVEVQFSFAHTGAAAGFTYAITWGATAMLQRVAGPGDAAVAGRTETSITAGTNQISGESFGTVLPLATVLTSSTASLAAPIQINFQGALSAATSDSIGLVNATVVRYPANMNP